MFDRYKDAVIRSVLWGLLISSLAATVTNLAWAFSVIAPESSKAAWFAAISFDGAVLIVSFYARRFERDSYAKSLARIVIFTNTAISIYANVYRAIEFQKELTRITGAAWNSMPVVLGFALPLLTWALAEILVRDEAQRTDEFVKEQRKEARKQEKLVQVQSSGFVQETETKVQMNKAEKLILVRKLVQEGCTTQVQIIERTGFSKPAVSGYVKELLEAGELIQEGRELRAKHDVNKHLNKDEANLELIVNK